MEKKVTVTETQVGNALIIVTAECSPTATETIEKKLERLISRHLSDAKKCPDVRAMSLAIYPDQSQYGAETI